MFFRCGAFFRKTKNVGIKVPADYLAHSMQLGGLTFSCPDSTVTTVEYLFFFRQSPPVPQGACLPASLGLKFCVVLFAR